MSVTLVHRPRSTNIIVDSEFRDDPNLCIGREAVETEHISITNLPTPDRNIDKKFRYLKNVQLADPYEFNDKELPILIGADYYYQVVTDASKKTYGTVTYLRIELNDGNIISSFVASKGRVAPLKTLSISRLELQGALLSSRLSDKIATALILPVETHSIRERQILESLEHRISDPSSDPWNVQSSNLMENQLVLLKDPNTKPLDWPMPRILEVFPGSDGLVRVVNVKTSTGILKRAMTKVVPFPILVDPATVEKNNLQFLDF
ncbi:DUF5641 domain-containing protein [Trichonephila clavipes]|nr:DUF5641 domain-containing protein [Trichonephila clavipes]